VRLLLDECVPKRLRQELPSHDVRTVPEMGWAGKENGELRALAESRFEVFVTIDQKLKYQQSVSGRTIPVVVLVAKRNKIEFLRPLVPELERALSEVKPGELREIAV
jgi:predicted nuclease of predicted toxin-antitoxin system